MGVKSVVVGEDGGGGKKECVVETQEGKTIVHL